MDWPKVWVLFATFKRTDASIQTIRSLGKYLSCPNAHYHICDDGSGETDDGTNRWHVGVLAEEFASFYPQVTWHEMPTPPGAFNTGGNINRGIHLAHENGADIHVLIFDDWALIRPLDLSPMVDILDSHDEVGFIRLSYYVPWLYAVTQRYDGPRVGAYMWWRLLRPESQPQNWPSDSYLISTQPYIAHRRFFEAYGYHPEHISPGEAEIGIGTQYLRSSLGENGPQILFPIGPITVHAPWSHSVGRANYYAQV